MDNPTATRLGRPQSLNKPPPNKRDLKMMMPTPEEIMANKHSNAEKVTININ